MCRGLLHFQSEGIVRRGAGRSGRLASRRAYFFSSALGSSLAGSAAGAAGAAGSAAGAAGAAGGAAGAAGAAGASAFGGAVLAPLSALSGDVAAAGVLAGGAGAGAGSQPTREPQTNANPRTFFIVFPSITGMSRRRSTRAVLPVCRQFSGRVYSRDPVTIQGSPHGRRNSFASQALGGSGRGNLPDSSGWAICLFLRRSRDTAAALAIRGGLATSHYEKATYRTWAFQPAKPARTARSAKSPSFDVSTDLDACRRPKNRNNRYSASGRRTPPRPGNRQTSAQAV